MDWMDGLRLSVRHKYVRLSIRTLRMHLGIFFNFFVIQRLMLYDYASHL